MQQTTIDEAIERAAHIERLARSMARWRERELDRVLPDEYARYQALIQHLRDGGAYVVRHFDPAKLVLQDRSGWKNTRFGQMLWDIAEGFAAVSRAPNPHRRRR